MGRLTRDRGGGSGDRLFFSSRRRHTRSLRDWSSDCALPIYELIRITRPGGFIVFTLRPEFYNASDFKDRLAALTTAGRWRWIETGDPFNAGFREFPDINLDRKSVV